ncbi:NCS2 family permease [Chengkuizengella sediminis]|uniref:NCS2 family permease n=1 Tax=Chengkuizengella sediminis TaxID=1885917 RepID=UPI00138992A4|nr:NCS2 family permease [Chengkuizengella sediminis]NDI34995.1 NCS2 family permease [Chengkuizengella sediminis]
MGKNNETGFAKYFEFSKFGTNYRRETVAGITTFLAMAYILFVNPDMLSAAGMDFGAVFTATAVAAIIGTLVMGLFAKYPIALAPGMGLNAFFTFSVVIGMGIPWEQALLGVLVSGIIFLILALTGVREAIINAIPSGLKHAAAAGIGLFIAFIGLKNAGIIVANEATFVTLGDLSANTTLLAIFGIVITAIFMTRKLKGAIFYGIVITTIAGMIFGIIEPPTGSPVATPPNASAFGALFDPLFINGEFDLSVMFSASMWIVIFTFLFVDFFDTAGTLVGVATQANLMKNGKLPRAGRALTADSVATITGAVMGTSTTTSYIESSAGVAAGGRTGFASVVTAGMFALSLFFFPLLSVITQEVTAPALIMVGVLMAASLGKIEWNKIEEAVPAFLTAITMPLTFSIATGIALGFILYPLTKIFNGQARKVHWIMYLMFIVFIAYFVWLA